jgi:hypothetical protein
MADSRAQAYVQQLDALTRQAKALSPEARQRIQKLLDEANRQILADLAHVASGSYTSARLQLIKTQVDRAMQDFGTRAGSEISALQAKTYKVTALSVDSTVAAGTGRVFVQPVIDRASLQVVQGYTADLITGLSHDASAKINAAIQRGFLGGANLQDTVKAIGSALEDGHFSGLFSEVGKRAMSIATNEVMRVQSLASVSRIRALAETHSGLNKEWLHIPVALVPRPGHLIASGQIRKPDEPFLVEGEELMYPRDPSGSADNTINCHCLVRPHLDEDQLKPTDQERALLKSYGLSVTAQAA